MSLKAKLEAVIYAAEEPVTLNQLASLFAADALEWKAEQEAALAEQAAEDAADAAQPMLGEDFAYLGQDAPTEAAPTEVAPEAPPVAAETASESDSAASLEVPAEVSLTVGAASDSVAETAVDVTPSTDAEPAPAVENLADGESELKRQARQRDREVRAILRQLLDEIVAECASDGRGVEIREIAGGFRMATKPECHDAVRLFVKSLKPPLKLSLAALETLAVVAYKQPVTAPEVSEIRGVEAAGVIGSLLARKLIATAGRKQVIGRPILYKTTKEFLLRFGLKDVAELPSMEEFEKMASIELDEPETVAENEMEAALSGEEEAGAEPEFDPSMEAEQNSDDLPIEKIDPGTAPESAETPAEQENTEASELPAQTPAETAAQNLAEAPAEMAAQTTADTPAETAARPSAVTDEPAADDAPEAELESRPADEPAANEPAS